MGEERRVDCVCTMTKVMNYGSMFNSLFSLLLLLIEKVQRTDRLQTRGRDMAVMQGAELKKVLTSCSMSSHCSWKFWHLFSIPGKGIRLVPADCHPVFVP